MRSKGSASSTRTRAALALLLAAGALQLVLTWLGLPGWVCPVRAATGWPCPGCGLSRALVELLRGHVATAMALHPLAPVVLASAPVIGALVVFPPEARRHLLDGLVRADRRLRASWLLAGGLLVHWALQIAQRAGRGW